MSQQETKPWVLVSNINEGINQQDMEVVSSQVLLLIDEWQSNGKDYVVWSV